MLLQDFMQECVKGVPACIGAGYVDLESGLPLAVVTNPPLDEDGQNLLAVGAVQAMSSNTIAELGPVLSPGSERAPFRETVILAPSGIHIFERMDNYPNEAVFLIFRPDADPAFSLRAARGILVRLSRAGIF